MDVCAVRDFTHKMKCICARCDLSKTKPQYARGREENPHIRTWCAGVREKLLHINELFKQLGTVLFALDNKIKHTPDQMEKPLVFFKLLNVFSSFCESRNISEKKSDDAIEMTRARSRKSERGIAIKAAMLPWNHPPY